jgi:AcrR family transcriptional regulator
MTMEQKRPAVNTRRRYDSRGRRERARQTRDQITTVAERLFFADGYAATTVAAIAAAAGVSVETIYKGFDGKPGLVRAIVQRGLAGAGPVPAEQRSDHIRDTEPDPHRILAAWGAFTAEIGPRVAPILTLARDAATADPEIAALLEEISAARHERMTVNARGLARAGHLRPGMTPGQAADIMWTYSSPELYDLLVIRRGWPAEQYGRFVGQALTAALLPARGT